jgi:hypothetical protein
MRMPATELVEHWYAAFRGLPAGPDRKRDVDALISVLYAVLPYLADWRRELADGLARGDGGRVIVPRFANVAVAEAIMSGLHDRPCDFVHHPEIGPCGVAMVHVPPAHQTALFKTRNRSRLVAGMVEQLAQQLRGVVRSGQPELDRRRVNEALRAAATPIHEEPRHYYFVYRDEAANPQGPSVEWELTLTALGDSNGLPHLALVRMQGEHDDATVALEALLTRMLEDAPPSRGDAR